MIRRTAVTTATLATALAALATVGACTSTDTTSNTGDTTTTQSSEPLTTPPSDEPIDLRAIPEGTALEPGTYAVGLLDDNGTTRAIVDVPAGYFSSFGGSVIGSDNGDIAFWGKVTQVDTDPCLGGKHVRAGTSVRDLASLLVAQENMTSTQPDPVAIGGYHGVHLETTAPADIQGCRGGIVTIYTAGGDWLSWDVPSATFDQWILNVNGHRVVGGARITPDAANRDEMVAMVESARFTVT